MKWDMRKENQLDSSISKSILGNGVHGKSYYGSMLSLIKFWMNKRDINNKSILGRRGED